MKNRILSVLICVLVLGALVFGLSGIFQLKSPIRGSRPFLDRRDYDVLFLGTSHSHNAFAPMELWKEEGITSYNLSVPGCRIPTAYWMLRCALDYVSPRVIVLDCAYVSRNEKAHEKTGYMHFAFDGFPFSRTKFLAAMDLYRDSDLRAGLLFPFVIYHDRWDELTEEDFTFSDYSTSMGHALTLNVTPTQIPEADRSQEVRIDSVGADYLLRILAECRKRNITVILTYLPFRFDEGYAKENGFLHDLAVREGVPFLDSDELRNVIREQTDFNNSNWNNSHVNWSGAVKLTEYIGKYLRENHLAPDRRNDPAYADWDRLYADYQAEKLETFRKQKKLYSWLIMASDPELNTLIEMNGTDWIKDPVCRDLVENLGGDVQMIRPGTEFAVFPRKGSTPAYLDDSSGSSPLGEIRREEVPDKQEYRVTVDGRPLYTAAVRSSSWLRITLLDGETGDPVVSALFSYSVSGSKIKATLDKE